MAVSRTIRTKSGISKFIIPSENGDEYVTAFKYLDERVEVHSLKKECAPLYLEENTTVNTLNLESCGMVLLSLTPRFPTMNLEIRLWDVISPLGFTPKEVSMDEEGKREGKFRSLFDVGSLMNESLNGQHISTAIGSLVCLLLNKNFLVFMKATGREFVTVFSVITTLRLTDTSPITDILFLCDQQRTYLALAEGSNIRTYAFDVNKLQQCNIIPLTIKRSKASFVSNFSKLTCSKCLVCDNIGHLSLLHVPDSLTPLNFPSSVGGHSINCVIGFKHTAEGILAICNADYTINLYKLADILCSVNSGESLYVKPYRVLCSQFPISSITFVKSDQLVLASAINQSLTFWGGFSSNITGG